MADLLAGMVRSRGHLTAVADEHRCLDWTALDRAVNRWIALLRGRGLSISDRVALVSHNRVEVFEILLACLHAGWTVVPINWHLTATEMAAILRDSACHAVIVDEDHAVVVSDALAEAGGADPVRLVLGATDHASFRAADPLLDAVGDDEPERQCCGSTLLYTSGSTGAPKGVVNGAFPLGAPLSDVDRLLAFGARVLNVPADASALLTGPWYHSAQLYFALLPLLRGCRLVIRRRFDAAETLRLLDEERIEVCHLVPTQFVRLLRLPAAVRAGFDGGSLRRVWHGGGPCAPAVKRRMIDWWGPILTEYYAATEGGVVTQVDSEQWLVRPGTVGRPVPPTRIHIAGPDGEALPAGTVGQVFLRRGPGQDFHYRGDRQLTRSVHLEPGVYTYGDLGYVDEDGYLFLTGRAQDVICSGGVNIHPAEVEAVLLAHPAVRDAAVLGVADEEFGERVLAVVELAGQVTVPELRRHCRTRLAGFKVPAQWRLVEELPRDETGKLRGDALRRTLGTESEFG